MGETNIQFSRNMVNSERDQHGRRGGLFQSEPRVRFGGGPQPYIHTLLPAPENHDGAYFHGMMRPYAGVTPYMMTPSGTGILPSHNNHMDGFRCLPKNKGVLYCSSSSASAGSSSSNDHMDRCLPRNRCVLYSSSSSVTRPRDSGITSVGTASFQLPPENSRNYPGQPFPMVNNPRVDQQQLSSIAGDGRGSLAWNTTYGHGSNLTVGPVHHRPQIYRGGHRSVHHAPPPPVPPVQGMRYVGSARTGLRIYRPRLRAGDATPPVIHNLPRLRVLPAEEVATLDIPGYYEVGNFPNRHREMELDIDHMSYEELLALGERIGNVGIGLSEETIISHLKTRIYTPSTSFEQHVNMDQETYCCVICQSDYTEEEKIGTLECGHEYHVDCIKKWLLVKNACPICKLIAIDQ